MIIFAGQLSSALIIPGIAIDPKYWGAVGSKFVAYLEGTVTTGKNLLKNAAKGFKELAQAAKSGSFWKLFKQWAKDDPIAAAAGAVAAGLAIAAVVIVGGTAIAAIAGGIGSLIAGGGLLGTWGP